MTSVSPTALPPALTELHALLVGSRATVLWKLAGMSEYDLRRPMTPTGTNLLGIVKHLTGVEWLYLGVVLDRAPADLPGWMTEDAPARADLVVTPEESTELIVADYRRAGADGDRVLASLPADAMGFVPWFPEPRMSLHRLVLQILVETQHHLGHLDILRELVDGRVGLGPEFDALDPSGRGDVPDAAGWVEHCRTVERYARQAADAVAS